VQHSLRPKYVARDGSNFYLVNFAFADKRIKLSTRLTQPIAITDLAYVVVRWPALAYLGMNYCKLSLPPEVDILLTGWRDQFAARALTRKFVTTAKRYTENGADVVI